MLKRITGASDCSSFSERVEDFPSPQPPPSENDANASEPRPEIDALTIGLDLLQALAESDKPKAMAELARCVNATRLQVFYTVKTLERRGYVQRVGRQGLYVATSTLFEQGIGASDIRHLLDLAREPMKALAQATGQSCNLSVPHAGHFAVVYQIHSPGPFGINVPLGFRYELEDSAPAQTNPSNWLERVHFQSSTNAVTNLSYAILKNGYVVAVLTISYIRTAESLPLGDVIKALESTVTALSSQDNDNRSQIVSFLQ